MINNLRFGVIAINEEDNVDGLGWFWTFLPAWG
jgi:hypothetical protein